MSSVREGLSRSVIEAMASGLVLVSTDVGAIREDGVDGENMIKSRLQEGALRTVEKEFSAAVVRRHWGAALRAVEGLALKRVPAAD